MQHRSGRGSAHISLPSGAGLLTEPLSRFDSTGRAYMVYSRLGQKTLGLTNRIWLILFLFLFIVTLTRFALPSDQTSLLPRHGLTDASNLKPINYLNVSDPERSPFSFCPIFGPGDDISIKYGAYSLTQSKVHVGSGARIQRLIHKTLSGLPVTISILGGSVSSCHGAGDDPISTKCYPARFFNWWNTIFPHPASELTNGALRRSTSAYFSFCSAHHLPDVTDLVVLEFDVDDPNDREWVTHFELLVRSILVRPDQPAVVILGHFSPQVSTTHGFYGPEFMHSVVAQFYDVPHISIKPHLYSSFISKPDSIRAFYADSILANSNGHELLADMLIHYFQSQICSVWATITDRAYDAQAILLSSEFAAALGQAGAAALDEPLMDKHGVFGGLGNRQQEGAGALALALGPGSSKQQKQQTNRLLRVPPGRTFLRPGETQPEEVAPFCVSAHDLINPLPPSLFTGSGWHEHHPPAGSVSSGSADYSGDDVTGTPWAHYWYSSLPTSRLRVAIQVGSGDVAVYYLKEPSAAFSGIEGGAGGSAVECWVDDNYSGAKLLVNAGDVNEATPTVEIIDRGVSRGSHFVECQLMGDEGQTVPAFRLLGIFSS